MRPGTPGFVAERLKQTREARGISATSLAEILGLTRQAIYKYELGEATPHPEITGKLSTILGVPVKFFMKPMFQLETAPIYYRSMSSATKSARTRAERRLEWLQESAAYLRTFVNFPRVNVPQFDPPQHIEAITQDDIEIMASECRRFWGLGDGPISNVTRLLEQNGAFVALDSLGADRLDAFSVLSNIDKTPYLIINSDKTSAARLRWNLAHELGHILLHRHLDKQSTPQFQLIEDQAHAFAGAFLLPATSFLDDFYVPTLDAHVALKAKWIVSIQALIMREHKLELINDKQKRYLFMNLGKRKWRTKEPLDDEQSIEKPVMTSNAIEMLVSGGVQTRSAIVNGCAPESEKDVEDIMGLKKGYLSDPLPPIVLSSVSRNPNDDDSFSPNPPDNIIAFPS